VLVELVPIVIVAAGVTILVAVTIELVSEMSKPDDMDKADYERCRKVNEACQIECDPYLDSGDPSGMPYHRCMRQCLEPAGCWGRTR
jgi:hypothetical protein